MASITAELLGDYRVDITNGTHTWRADEPLDLGGDDTGPNPYDLLLGSLFRRQGEYVSKRKLLILLTATIIAPEEHEPGTGFLR